MTISKKTQKYIVVAVIVLSAALLVIYPYYELRYADSRTDCFPYKVWLIDKTDKTPVVGDFIVFRTPAAVSHIPAHKTWVKKVLADAGAKINVTSAGNGELYPVTVSGMEKKLPVRARVTVEQNKVRETFIAFAVDSMGRSLPVIGSQTIPVGHYYAYSPVERSYDSRYWGLVRQNAIIGKAYPVF